MAEDTVSLNAVEAFLQSGSKTLRLPPALERQFERDTGERRAKRLRIRALATIGIYNVFLVGDILLVPDRLRLALGLHLAVVTPLMLIVAAALHRNPPAWLRESLAASLPLGMALQILTVFALSSSPDADHYQYFVLLTVLYTGVIQRLSFTYASTVFGLILVAYVLTLCLHRTMPPAVGASAFASLICCVYVSLVANFYAERDARRTYLNGLRNRLRQAQAEAASRRDTLTELGNRLLLNEELAALWQRAGAGSMPVAAVMLDIDQFKAFNDCYGHPAGDVCLRRVAACVTAHLQGKGAFAVRYGGEEILVLLPRTALADAVMQAERIRRAVESMGMPHEGAGLRKVVTISLGVAAATVASLTAAELIAAADGALYAAKRNGRNQVWPPLLRSSEDGAAASVRFEPPAKAANDL